MDPIQPLHLSHLENRCPIRTLHLCLEPHHPIPRLDLPLLSPIIRLDDFICLVNTVIRFYDNICLFIAYLIIRFDVFVYLLASSSYSTTKYNPC